MITFPMIIFLLSISLSWPALNHTFLWLYLPMALLSPVLTVICGVHSVLAAENRFGWVGPFTISLIGFIPIWGIYFSLASAVSIWNDYFIIAVPIIEAIFAYGIALIYNSVKTNLKSS